MHSDFWCGRSRIVFVVIVGSWLALSWPWLSGQLTIPYDAKAHFQAQIQFLATALHSGQSPFWTPNVFVGSPQIADPQSLIFSPAILLALLSPQPSFTLVDGYVLGLLGIGELAIIMLFRDRNWHPVGAVIAAIAFGFGASAAWRIQHVGQIKSYAFCAVALWLLARAMQRRSIACGAAAGVAAGLMIVEPDQVAMLGAYVLAMYAVSQIVDEGLSWRTVRRHLPPLAAGCLCGVLIAIGPLVLTWLFLEQSNRPEIAFAEAARGSLHPASLLTAIIGDLYGALDPKVDYWGPSSNAWSPNELSLSQNMGQVYVGALPALLLLTVGLARGALWAREIRIFTIALALMVLYALGDYTPLFKPIYHVIPGVSLFRRPADATFLIGMLAAIIGGYLAHVLITTELPKLSRHRQLLGPALVGLLMVAALVLAFRHGHIGDAIKPTLHATAWLAAAGAALAWLSRDPRRHGTLAVIALAAFMSGDLYANNGPNESTALPVAQFDVLNPNCKNETIRFLKSRLKANTDRSRRDRVELVGLGFSWPNLGLIHNFDHLLGYNPLRIELTAKAVGAGDTIAGWEQRQFTKLFPSYRSLLADMLSLRYIATPIPVELIDKQLKPGDLKLIARTTDAFIYENPRAMPRVMFVPHWQAADFTQLVDTGAWPQFDPTSTLLLETAPEPLAPPKVSVPVPTTASAVIAHFENTIVEIEVDAPSDGFVLMNSAWHPWWRATVDDAPATILKANVMFRAMQVAAGRHRVRLSFEPLSSAIEEITHREPKPAPIVRQRLAPRRPHA